MQVPTPVIQIQEDAFGQLVRLVVIAILGVISYFLKRVISSVDKLEDKVETLGTKVAVLIDRDRRKRLKDYRLQDTEDDRDEIT
jgi:hypothetical protein